MKAHNLKILILFFTLIFSFFYGQQKRAAEEKVRIEEKIELFPFEDSTTGKWGYKNKEGKFVINPQFDYADNFFEGLARVLIDGKWGYINKEGKIVINPQFDWAFSFSDDLAAIVIGDKLGFINKEGRIAIQPQFDWVYPFFDGLTWVKFNDREFFIDKEGKIVKPEGELFRIFVYSDSEGKYGYIDRKFNFVIAPQFKEAYDFSEGLAVVRIGDWKTGKYGYINKEGKIVIKPKFDEASDFSNGLAQVKIGNKRYYINKKGKIVKEVE